ncbi:CYFA0S06e04808g1_1 [Cyberlindnera fabianii]|uniref:Ribonuclease P protein subunit n=1 Tax=Cyberlindnera fabianii TaxID=36022 RepID=A0A061AUD0_CYBFA|nr:Ribonuclease P protein subunit p29 [Cyberlindnera fabianii]CDR41246.1 CYFA0S06e04808g1_1 [Cyberlindnera fabianii]
MDRKYPLEALLISRSHSAPEVIELLSQRYAVNDKPLLSLRPTEGEPIKKSNKGLLTSIREQKARSSKKPTKTQHTDKTKLVFKQYIHKSLHNQRLLRHKLHRLQKDHAGHIDHTKFKEWKNIPHFSQFLTLNKLWTGYMQDLLGLTPETVDKAGTQQTLTKLASADYNGCFLHVLKSKNSNLVGKSGIVIWDAKNYFIVVEDGKLGGGLKMLEKKGTTFNFVVPLYDIDKDDVDENDDNYVEFSIIGSRFQYRSADRAGRKFKSRNVDDL